MTTRTRDWAAASMRCSGGDEPQRDARIELRDAAGRVAPARQATSRAREWTRHSLAELADSIRAQA